MSCEIQLVLGLGASQVLNPLMPLEAKNAECSSAERYDPISLLLGFERLASTIFMSSLVRKGTCPRPFRRNDDRFGAAPNGWFTETLKQRILVPKCDGPDSCPICEGGKLSVCFLVQSSNDRDGFGT